MTMKKSTKQKMASSPRVVGGSVVLLLFILCGTFAPFLASFIHHEPSLEWRLAAPSLQHWLGCDLYGQSLLKSLLLGARTSLYVGSATLGLSLSIGVILGLFAGYKGGWIDHLLMRLVDIFMAFPGILLAMSLASVMGPSIHNVILSISATGWTSTARLVRGQVLSLREREDILASVAIGSSLSRTLWIHLFPKVVPHLLVTATFSMSGVILVEASLSFLGLGAQGAAPSWGGLLNQGKEVLMQAPHVSFFPGLAIFMLVLGLNFFGDGLRDVLDPKDF